MKTITDFSRLCVLRTTLTVLLVVVGASFICPCNALGAWTFQCPRSEVAPLYWEDSEVLYDGQPTLALAGGGKDFSNGKWVQTVSVSPNTYYRFTTYFLAEDIQDLWQCVLSRITWQTSGGGDIGEHGSNVEFPPILHQQTPDGWYVMQGTYKSRSTAAKAKIELNYRFDGDGVVHFGGTEFVSVPPPTERTVTVGTVFYRATGPTTSSNINQYGMKVGDANALGADIVCLPEGMTTIGTGQSSVGASESVPGPSTNQMGIYAAFYGVYIVGHVFEREGAAVYNTAVLIDPNGDFVGKFRKTCLPREEIDGGVAPGDSYPVFDTDFGRIGMMVCWDNQFPLPARMLTLAGAEIIFFPNWGGTMECTIARCVENQVYIVSSTNSLSHDMESAVFSRQGEILVQASTSEPVVVTELNLDEIEYLWWIGDYRHRRLREMPFGRAGGILRTADLDGSDKIDMRDFAIFADSWLVENIF
jgi:predicted amidohydrolase